MGREDASVVDASIGAAITAECPKLLVLYSRTRYEALTVSGALKLLGHLRASAPARLVYLRQGHRVCR